MDGTSESGRDSAFTSENILRVIILMLREQKSLGETEAMIGNSHVLQDFARPGNRTVMSARFRQLCVFRRFCGVGMDFEVGSVISLPGVPG